MNIDILNLVRNQKNERSIDIALPVFAIECEVTPPLDNDLDAYEETVLKLIAVGLSARGISQTLNATESLVEEILENLELKQYAEKEPGEPWRLTEAGEKYLNGIVEERASENSKFGYMFFNAIKREVLPYFYEGDLNQAPLFKGGQLPAKLTLNGNEEDTFSPYTPKRRSLKEAFKKYYKNLETAKQFAAGEITLDEAVDQVEAYDLFEGLESFDEIDVTDSPEESEANSKEKGLSGNVLVRALNCPLKYEYLTMRVIIDPAIPGGYIVESPFDLGGIDNSYYLRQIQWMVASGNTWLGAESLDSFLTREIKKLAPNFKNTDKDFSVFVLEKMPMLKPLKDRFKDIYDHMGNIYSLMQRQKSMVEKENIVNTISRKVLERLFNEFFKGVNSDTLASISQTAKADLSRYKSKTFKQMVMKDTALDQTRIYWSDEFINSILWRLERTKGNSTVEKFVNVIVLNYYIGTPETRRFLTSNNVQKMYDLTDKLNKIRRKVSHDTEEPFEAKDYEDYMANVFTLINGLLEVYKEI